MVGHGGSIGNVYHQMAIGPSHQSMLTDEGSDVTWW